MRWKAGKGAVPILTDRLGDQNCSHLADHREACRPMPRPFPIGRTSRGGSTCSCGGIRVASNQHIHMPSGKGKGGMKDKHNDRRPMGRLVLGLQALRCTHYLGLKERRAFEQGATGVRGGAVYLIVPA